MTVHVVPVLSILLLSINFSVSHVLPDPDYRQVLKLSLLFYEAQRSGRLPENNRIKWRGDSALNDRGLNGEDLTGGYYDASDYVKFGFTMAFTTSVLAWSVLSYEDAYRTANQYGEALDAIKWASEYFIKCHVSASEFYGQVGDFVIDHHFWGRPEDINMTRPAYKIDTAHPGSDLAGEVAAALAATSLVFEHEDETFSRLSKEHAIDLYNFAINYKGFYHDAIPGAKDYYESPSYGDELTWAAIWMYKATRDKKYLNDAESFFSFYNLTEEPKQFYYNYKSPGIQVLLAQETKKGYYVNLVHSFCDYVINVQRRTPKGLVYFDKAGTLSHAANVAYVCLQATTLNMSNYHYINFAKEQIDYMLGSAGRSFLIGYGRNFPKKPHHAPSSCADVPEPCGWDQYKSKQANPKILYGALVSGPDQNDYYDDRRDEFLYNEVTIDYNAGFQGAVAGLIKYLGLANKVL